MDALSDAEVKQFEKKANEVRQTIIEMLVAAGSGHTAGPLGMADIFTALYFRVLRHDAKNPEWPERDRLILSNGHIAPVLYAVMAHAGYFPVEECLTLRKFGSRLQGHPERERLSGLETTSGPLGSGLSQAAGMAYASRVNGDKNRIYCAMSDGEHDCGNLWEAAMFAGANRLSNLTGIVDRNNIQIDGYTESIMPLEPFREKYESFGWHVLEVDGHNIPQFIQACGEAAAIYEKPTVIIAHTIPGKGIREIERDYRWHGKPPHQDEAKRFLAELRTLQGKIVSEHE
ncbi:transketolase [Candidatus Kaiserbacteria bacterium RIFCSPHIGHO2_02_FULL_55_25]|uniref:Transketolase n=1 Tax=Candidatus Kaiserbacteria bacterium RIFCSPHIGHO2_02_FULL_55_25 TaxID=1798498 RepID=A0A1F6E9Z2_9BACT|nr:MAG: transketolase [Candidatus Kaiserbacteria bacterium RIFCSPHIGHO2_02_FULL_55_25]OGG77474.1 MAG: transketolase [Candidatus Kaiserbacteria bacterium RIFCSPHIGHO2_12_FULL_55_13]OGG82901.1 MAG: transketolase [Candidatus Kaiserbacteria bacterium RIFCSPLOWO2_01_FULL_55_25]